MKKNLYKNVHYIPCMPYDTFNLKFLSCVHSTDRFALQKLNRIQLQFDVLLAINTV